MVCPECGYMLSPFDKTCPRCEKLKQQPNKQANQATSLPHVPKRTNNFRAIVVIAITAFGMGAGISYLLIHRGHNQVSIPTSTTITPPPQQAAIMPREVLAYLYYVRAFDEGTSDGISESLGVEALPLQTILRADELKPADEISDQLPCTYGYFHTQESYIPLSLDVRSTYQVDTNKWQQIISTFTNHPAPQECSTVKTKYLAYLNDLFHYCQTKSQGVALAKSDIASAMHIFESSTIQDIDKAAEDVGREAGYVWERYELEPKTGVKMPFTGTPMSFSTR